jgi:5-methylcytosine-specific restriction endonuclease McrA
LRLKIDPGSKYTGLALVQDQEVLNENTGEITNQTKVLNLIELQHRGWLISKNLTSRSSLRRRRRTANLRYRKPRFLNRTKPEGWIAPSLQHRVDTIMSWVERFSKLAPITAISSELVKFDMQKMQNPETTEIEYQRGELFGYEVREYLLEKWNRQCSYCGIKDVPLEIDHIHPRSKGGSNRVSNLTLSCRSCNQRKSNQPIEQFLANNPTTLKRILAQAKAPLKDAAAVNSTRKALVRELESTGLPVELGTGGQTKYNRRRLNIHKTHALDAVCVGNVDQIIDWHKPTLIIKCTGRGSYQRTRVDKHGFPRGYLIRKKQVHGFQTGDLVKAVVTKGKKTGIYVGRVAVRATGNFNVKTSTETIQGISYKYCKLLQRNDGYGYESHQQYLKEESGEVAG